MAESTTVWDIVNVVLTALILVPLFVVWVISICTARRRSDPARRGVTLLNICFPVLCLAYFFYVVGGIIFIIAVDGNTGGSSFYALYGAELRLNTLGVWFIHLADILFIMTVVEFAIGFLFALDHTRTSIQSTLRWLAVGVCILMFALTTAMFGLTNAAWTPYLAAESDPNSTGSNQAIELLDHQLLVAAQLSMAYQVLFMVIGILLVIFTSVVFHKVPRTHPARKSASFLIVCSVLFLLRYTWGVAYQGAFGLTRTYSGPWVSVVDPILDQWPFFIALVLLFAVARRKHANGLWTTAQPWMSNPPVPFRTDPTAAGYYAQQGTQGQMMQQQQYVNQPQAGYWPQQQQQGGQPGNYVYPHLQPGQQIVGWQLRPMNELEQPHQPPLSEAPGRETHQPYGPVHEAESRQVGQEPVEVKP